MTSDVCKSHGNMNYFSLCHWKEDMIRSIMSPLEFSEFFISKGKHQLKAIDGSNLKNIYLKQR